MSRLARGMTAALLVGLYTVLAPMTYGLFMLWGLWPTSDPLRRARTWQAMLRRAFTWMHGTLRITRLLDFDPRRVAGLEQLPDGPCVLVGNHPTLCDVTSALATFSNVTVAVKPNIYRRGMFRPLLRGSLQFEGATRRRDIPQVVDDAVDRLRRGFRVLIFPEGTRSPEGGLRPFGRTAFEIACRAGVPVVPLVVECTPVWLSKQTGIFAIPFQVPRMTVRVLPPVHPADHGSSSRRVRDVVQAGIQQSLGLSATIPDAPAQRADGRPGKSSEAPHRRVLDA